MKIVSYIPPICVAALMVAGYQYASNQVTTMRMLVDANSGLGTESAGMTLTNKNLDSKAATVAKKRKDALEASAQALVMLQKAQEDLDAAKFALDEQNAKKEDLIARIAEMERRAAEIREQNEKIIENIHSVPLLADTDPEEANAKIAEYVKEFDSKYESAQNELDSKIQERTKLTDVVSGLEVDLANRKDTNKRFMDAYRANSVEYTVEAVDPQWHFVVFKAGEKSGFYAGDSTPLLVQRDGVPIAVLRIVSVSGGQVVAEYDEKALPRGVRIEVGDRIFRQKPVGS